MTAKLVLLVIITAFIVGCSGSGGSSGDGQVFIGGSEALSLKYLEGAPPIEMFDNGQFPYNVDVQMENIGEIDVPAGRYNINLAGINLDEFGLALKTSTTDMIEGAYLDSQGNQIPGGIVYWEWAAPNGYPGIVTAPAEYTLWAEACFEYGSEAQGFLCYKADDMLDQDENALCKIRESKSIENAASPIKISQLTESPQGSNKIAFTFEITHVGPGQLYAPSVAPALDCINDYASLNTLQLTVDTGVTPSQLSCNFQGSNGNSGTVHLVDGSFILRCTEDVPGGSDFQSVLKITSDYNYKIKKSVNMRVVPTD